MDIYMVGLYKGSGDIKGFRMLSFDDTNKQINDVEYSKVYEILRSKKANIANLKLEKGEIKGYNGKIDRYGVVGKSQALVILREVQNDKGDFEGYMCSDSLGNMRFLTEQQVIGFATSASIANGKVVTDATGKSRVSAIEGTYEVYRRKPQTGAGKQGASGAQTQGASGAQNQNKAPINLDAETINILNRLKAYPEYNNSFAKKVEDTINKTRKCTDKQKSCLKKILADLDKKNSTGSIPAPNIPAQSQVKQASNTPVEDKKQPAPTPTQSTHVQQRQAPSADNNKVCLADMFNFENMNGQLYIKSLRKEFRSRDIDLVIPDTLEYNGKSMPVMGISSKAFSFTNILSVKTGRNIRDIGQEAFLDCYKLKVIDLSASQHQHIAMRTCKNCKSLREAYVGNYVQRIHESAFENCPSLQEITLPDTTDTIARIAFENCTGLKSVNSKVTTINDSAFRGCSKLQEFNFSNVVNIGTQAFRYTAFEKLVLPGNITVVGKKAFSDCFELKEVELQEGIEVLGEYCFAKPKKSGVPRNFEGRVYRVIDNILTCKSIKEIGADAFRNAALVKVYTGSVSESQCIGFNIPHMRLDDSNNDNSTRVRIKSEVVDSNPIEVLFAFLTDNEEGASNPPIELNTSKLVDIPFNKTNFDFFGIEQTTQQIQPHAKFIGLVNYLEDVADLFTDPLANGVLRLQKTYNVHSEIVFNDGCNRVYKVTYSLMDTLEEGGFIMVIMDNHLRYITELTIATDVHVSEYLATDENIPIKKFIHAGDKIGKTSTISGKNGILVKEDGPINVGDMFFERLSNHCIEIVPQRKDSIWYIPVSGLALKLHDKREWEKDTYSANGKRIARNSEDCLNVIQVLTYEELLAETKKFKKHSMDSNKFFKNLNKMTNKEVEDRIKFLDSVEEEKEAQLFRVSKQFIAKLQASGIDLDKATPNDLTMNLFDELSMSYWMITKDEKWLSYTGTKSLNKTNEYIIDKCKLTEYKSNQVVKFSNPYMNGQKGAYVFTLESSGRTRGVYASRHSMQDIVKKLVKLTQMKLSTVPIDLMTNAYSIDICEHDLFYNFYDVLYSKDGWRFKDYCYGYERSIWNISADFHIAMYKPTGIFYLTMESYVSTNSEQGRRTMPILPIGNMDRALMIATTTNSKNKDSKLLEELIVLSASVLASAQGKSISSFKFKRDIDINAYSKARELVIQGVRDISQYKSLINDRVVYMLGTVHKGRLQREYEYQDGIDIDDISMDDLYTEEDIDIELPDTSTEGDDAMYEEGAYEDDIEIDYGLEDDIYEEDEEEDGESNISLSYSDVLAFQQQLKAAGHDISISQARLILMQQMNK